MTVDPKFVDRANGDYRLQAGSPAIDAGLNLGYGLDHDDQAVPSGATTDIGAFEHPGQNPSAFDFSLSFGICSTDTIDSLDGLYTRDTGSERTQLALELTDQQMTAIHDKALEIDFFNYPDIYEIPVASDQPRGIREPAFTYRLTMTDGEITKTVVWKDNIFFPTATSAEHLRDLIDLIRQSVEGIPAIEELPPIPPWCL
jgi:hypothetical protein